MHGDRIEVHSAGTGKGSEFAIRLPIVSVPKSSTDLPKNQPATVPPHHHRILIVDDNRDAANTLSMLLQLLGHDAQTVYDDIQALQAAASFHPALVLLDIGLPKMNGYEVAKQIRQQPWART